MINILLRDALPRLPAETALFLNLDGLLGSPRLLGLLLALRGRLQGALGIITTQPLGTVDRIFAPVLLAGAGRAGAELRLNFNHPVRETGGALPQALHMLMTRAPFQGRIAVLAGDEDTDPAALLAVEDLGGIGIRLCAPAHRLPDLIAHHWLRNRRSPPRNPRSSPRFRIPPGLFGAPRLARPLPA